MLPWKEPVYVIHSRLMVAQKLHVCIHLVFVLTLLLLTYQIWDKNYLSREIMSVLNDISALTVGSLCK